VFGEASDDELGFAFESFDREVEPAVVAQGVAFEIEADFEDVVADLLDGADVAAFEVGAEGGTA
jgi:hypothetical protein